MIQVKTVLAQILSELSLNLVINSVTDNGDSTYTLSVESTQYLNQKMVFDIDSVEYTVIDFTLNESLTISGASAPTTGIKTLPSPTFVHGKYKAVNKQLQQRQPEDYLPLVWMYELLPRTEPDDPLSSIDTEGDVRLYFCMSSNWADWDSSEHYDQVFDPLTNVIDAFVSRLKSSPLIGELGTIERTNHAKFSTGGFSISGNQENAILPAYISAIEVLVDLPILTSARSCSGLRDTSCAPGLVKDQNGNDLGLAPSGGVLEVNTAGLDATVENSDESYTNTVASGGTLVLPDINVTDSDGSVSSVPSVKDVLCTPAADATVENSDSSYTNTVASGGTLTLPDITVTDSDGSTFTQASVVNVVCTLAADGTVNVNSVFFDNVASGATLNIQVMQSSGSTLIGSKQGADFRIPDSVITLDNTDGSTLSTTNVLATDALTITAPDATAVIKNTLNAVLRSELIPSNVSEDIIISDSTININQSDGTLIASATITAEGSGAYNVADSTINVVNSLATVLSSSLVKATDTESVLAPDVNVANSDSSYTNTVPSGTTLALPDISITINGEAQPNQPAAKNLALSYAVSQDYEFRYVMSNLTESAGLVSALIDQSSNNNDATQSNGAYQPSYTASDPAYNNKPTITVYGDWFDFDLPVPHKVKSGSHFWWVGVGSNGAAGELLGTISNAVALEAFDSSSFLRYRWDLDGSKRDSFTLTDLDDAAVWLLRSDGTTHYLYKDGSLKGSVSIVTSNVFWTLLFTKRTTYRTRGTFAEVMLKNENASVGDLNTIGQALATEYGFTWNTIV